MAVLKKPIKKVAPAEEEIPMEFHIDQAVKFEDDGTTYEGVVTDINEKKRVATVKVDEDSYEVGFDELSDNKPATKTLKTPIGGKKLVAGKSASKGGDDFSTAFNRTQAAAAGGGLPAGKHKACAMELGLKDNDKGLAGFIKFTVADPESEVNDKSGIAFYQLMNAEGEEQEGFGYFKRDLILLGLDESFQISTRSELEDELSTIANKEVYVEITVREKGGYTNIFLNEVLDQDDKP